MIVRSHKLLRDIAFCIFCLLAGFCSMAYADDLDVQVWAPVTLEFPVNEKFQGFMRVQPRTQEGLGEYNRLVLQPALAYPLNDKTSLWVGYLYAHRNQSHTQWEHRLWQQVMSKHALPFGNLEIQHRARIEQRFMHNAENMGWRGRYRLLLFKYLGESPYYVFTGDEFLLNFNNMERADDRGLVQNRVHAGVGRKVGKNSRIEAGYMFIIGDQDLPVADRARHVGFVNVWINVGRKTLYDVRDKGL